MSGWQQMAIIETLVVVFAINRVWAYWNEALDKESVVRAQAATIADLQALVSFLSQTKVLHIENDCAAWVDDLIEDSKRVH